MPNARKPELKRQLKPQIMTCMGLHDEDHPLAGKGPLYRADGAASYNGHFWPLHGDDFWANRELGNRYSSRWHVTVIALADGTWLSDGSEYRAVQYPTRQAALRIAVARLIRTLRSARRWNGFDRLNTEDFRALVAWALGLVGRPPPRFRVEAPPPPLPPAWSDLPLFAEPGSPTATPTSRRGRA